jgi:hypothetical protein
MAQPTEYEQVSYNAPDGVQVGNATSCKIGFYGTTPASIYADCGAASTYTAYQQSTGTASTWGFNSQAAVTSLIRQVSTITQALRGIGLIV